MKRIAITQPLFLLQFFIVALSSWVLPSLPAHAEGSLQLVHEGPNYDGNSYRLGNRPYLEFLPGTLLGGIPFSTTIKVYAQSGETLNLGSSAMGRGPNGDIIVRPPTGGPVSCLNNIKPTVAPAVADFGRIDNLTEELNGPLPTAGGYRPCVINVNQTGVWEIDFVSPDFSDAGSPPDTATNAAWSQPNDVPYVAAWDVTVRDSGGNAIEGRAFTNSLAMITGGNDRPIHSELFVQTTDGYRYRVDLNGLDPNGFVFFANNKGFLEASTGNPLYRSVGLNGFDLPPGVDLHLPTDDNDPTTGDFTHQIFFNPPDTAVLIDTLDTDNIDNFRFEGSEGNTLGQAGTSPLGGSFKFTPPSAGTATLTIDANGNNSFNDPEDVQLTQYVLGGVEAQIFWDGTDGEGNVVPPRNIPYRVQLEFPFGEVHFPLVDPENSNGIIIERLPTPGDFTIYYNDDDPDSTTPGPRNNDPIDSRSGVHGFPGTSQFGFGNEKGIDRWTFFTPPPIELTGGILIAEADLKITKTRTPDPAIAGGNITYTITVTNDGPSNITTESPATVSDIFTANGETVTNLSWTCAITTPDVGGTCIDESGTESLTNARLALNAGASAEYTLTGTIIPTATQDIVNQATVTRPNDVADPVNDDPEPSNDNNRTETATVTVPLTSGSPLLGVAKAAGTPIDNGDRTFTIPYTLVVRNYGNLPLNTLQVTENLDETFENLTYTLEPNSLSSPTLTVNPNFNGNTDINLLAPGNTLAVDDTGATINFAVRVTPGNNLGPFENQVTASGVTPGGTEVSDLSTNGANPRGNNDTGDPTDSNEITSVTLRGNPNLELEKRITRVNGVVVGQSENLTDWPANFVRGVASSNTIQPGDEVEYTIYFLSSGSGPLENAMVCDPLQDFQTFRTDTFNGQTPTEGTFGAEVGIALALNPPNPDLPTAYLRSANSDSNRGRFYPSGTATPLICEQNVRGAVVVDIGELGVGDYGFIRFRVTID